MSKIVTCADCRCSPAHCNRLWRLKLYNDSERIRSCMKAIQLNSSYYNIQPLLMASNLTRGESNEDGSVTIHVHFTAKNEGIGPLTFEKVI